MLICILQPPCCNCLLVPEVFCWFFGIFCIENGNTINHIICKHWQFCFFFLMYICFISFPCLNALARSFSMILNSSGESGYPCLIPSFKEKASSFSPLSMLTVCSLWMLLMWLRSFLSIASLPRVLFFF